MARFLVVDDEPIIAMTIADWLADLDHTVLGPAADLASALAFAEEEIDGAILDISLGRHTTVSLAVRLIERGVPFTVVSGHAPETISPAFAQGLILCKPFGFESFRCVVKRLLQSKA
jgi:DNA-binding response OmpR family regulator